MNAKRAAAPRNGGSAGKAIVYVLAEELTAKVVHAQANDPIHPEQRAELSALMAESLARSDRGLDVVWSPSTAADGRPSSVYCRGVASLYSASIEMQSLFDAQTRCKSPVAHYIFSLNTAESATVSDEQLIRATMATLDGCGWAGHAAVAAVHQDTMKWVDGELVDGNKHCHVAIASVNSETLRAYDRTQEYLRLSKSVREQEIAFGMEEDWGLYKIADRGLPTERVERTKAVDWEARKQEKASERVERIMRSFVSDEGGLESTRDREDRIVHALRDYLERCEDRGEKPLRSDVHLILGRLTARYEGVIDNKLTVRLMERAEEGSVRKTWTDSFGEVHAQNARSVPTTTVFALDEKRIAHSPLDDYNGKAEPHPMLEVEHERALERRAFLLGIKSAEEAEVEYRQVIAEDPGRVARDLVYGQGQANFTSDDVDALLAQHITEGWSEETDRVLREDPTIRILSADTQSPLYTIEKQRDISDKFDQLLRELLAEKDPLFDRAALDEAIRRVEARQREKNPNFTFTAQQHKALESFDRRLTVWVGDAGTGKTVLNEVHAEMAEIAGREIRGFATAQKAADVLAESSGIRSVNQARALAEESRDGVAVMPENARFVFDEFSMASIESGVKILERAKAAQASGVLQLDLAQLPNLAAGNTGGIASRAAADNKALIRLSEVFRQREGSEVAFMREAVPRGGKAIRTANREAYAAYVEEFMDRGLVTHHETRQEEIAAIAADILDAMKTGERVIAPGRSFQDCLYVNRAVRAGLGLQGTGTEFEFDRGVIELAAGDRVLFRANNRKMDVRNGDTGTVIVSQRETIEAKLDNGTTVSFNPARYKKIEYGYASTIHANQGTGAPVVIGSITKGDDARSVHVTVTRTESVLHVHTHLKRDEILKQLSSDRSLAPKDDALLFAAIVAKTGGPETMWARSVKTAMAFDADPLRQRHEAVMAQRADDMRKAIIGILDGQPDIKARERDRQMRAAAERYAPESFVTWVAGERAALEHEWEVRERMNGEIEHERRMAKATVAAMRNAPPAIDPQKKANLDIALASSVAIAGTPAAQYLASRGVTSVDGVQFSPNWTEGVVTNSARVSPGYGPAVVFPFHNAAGDVVAAQGRFIDPPMFAAKPMKVWSVGAVSQGVFWTPGARESPVIGICEAPIDALSLAQTGLPAIALGGTQNQPTFLAQVLAGREVVVGLDADAPGIAAAAKLEELLYAESETTRFLLPGNCKDLNEALMSAPDALAREVERCRQKLFDPLQRAWVNVHHAELGTQPAMSARKAQTRRSFGTLGGVETALLDRAEALAKTPARSIVDDARIAAEYVAKQQPTIDPPERGMRR